MKVHHLYLWIVVHIFLFVYDVNGICRRVYIRNGYSRRKIGSKIAYFCLPGYIRYGARVSECDGNQWKSPPPLCIVPGCPAVQTNRRRDMDLAYKDAVVIYTCLEPYVLVGKATAYCDGTRWSSPAPECKNPENVDQCDFEDGEFCGWTQESNDNFDWTRQSGPTNTGNTGPDFDHTLGPKISNGHYIYIESTAPRMAGHEARLLSPIYPPAKSGQCFHFWYHMLGPNGDGHVGSLTISLRYHSNTSKESDKGGATVDDIILFTIRNNQGSAWKQGEVYLDKSDRPFQISLNAVRQLSYMGDIAVDDIGFQACQGVTTPKSTTTTEFTTPEITSRISIAEVTTAKMTTKRETTPYSSTTETRTAEMESSSIPTTTTQLTTTNAHVLPTSSSSLSSFALSTSGTTDVIGSDVTNAMTSSSTHISSSVMSTQINATFEYTSATNEDNSEIIGIFEIINKITSAPTHTHTSTTKPKKSKAVAQNVGVFHTVSFVVSLTVGIAVIVIGALIIAFIVHRLRKQNKHYSDDDFETMHVATYRKQSTDGLIL